MTTFISRAPVSKQRNYVQGATTPLSGHSLVSVSNIGIGLGRFAAASLRPSPGVSLVEKPAVAPCLEQRLNASERHPVEEPVGQCVCVCWEWGKGEGEGGALNGQTGLSDEDGVNGVS